MYHEEELFKSMKIKLAQARKDKVKSVHIYRNIKFKYDLLKKEISALKHRIEKKMFS